VTVRSYRIVKRKWQDSAFDGEGARRFPGRWNNRGTPMLYTASTRSLAILEILVHFEAEDLLREHFVVFELSIPDACLLQLDTALPDDWMEPPVTASTRAIGEQWISSRASAALAVPSVIVPSELNYLINPGHPDFRKIKIGQAEPLGIDPRLLK
jgi:RES domain-containing protein